VIVLKPRDFRTGSVEDAVYDAVFQRAGILRVNNIEQLFGAAETVATARPVYSDRLTIISNSYSLALMTSDTLLRHDGHLAEISEATREKVQNHLLLELGTKISVSLDTNQLLEQILDLISQVVRYDAAGIYIVDKETQWIKQQTFRGYDPTRESAVRLKVGHGLIGWVAKTGRGVIVPDVARDERYVNARPETRSEIVAPLRAVLLVLLNYRQGRSGSNTIWPMLEG
jgi:putative methionine-R-sulfoxide reductase with GAF domain